MAITWNGDHLVLVVITWEWRSPGNGDHLGMAITWTAVIT
jgi:hypothetical protein